MDRKTYALNDTSALISPALIYYPDLIMVNTKKIIEMAGGAEKLWPHVKSHKSADMIRMQIDQGIKRFKCATIAEAEVCAETGATHIILAYPLIGPNISRFLRLASHYAKVTFYAIGDDLSQFTLLSGEAEKSGVKANVLVDADLGMHRTGVPIPKLEEFYTKAAALKGISLKGLHCYDGHLNDADFKTRKAKVDEVDIQLLKIQDSLTKKGLDCGIMVMGGTPTFPCRTGKAGMYLSPGTCFLGDWSHHQKFLDMNFPPAAAIFCRVVSQPTENSFTVDLGYKGIAADPPGDRGVIAGFEQAKPLFQSEEHWVFSLPQGQALPAIGSDCYVIPTHICPTSALYPQIQIARDGKITKEWPVSARNRKINY